MGFTSKEIKESLHENRYDEVCATYMLLKRELGDSNVRALNYTIVCCWQASYMYMYMYMYMYILYMYCTCIHPRPVLCQ